MTDIGVNNQSFEFTYSAKHQKEIENIRKKYMPHEESKLDTLKKLDRRVQSAGMIESLCIGIVGALVFGVGMCFGLDALEGADWLTLLFGILGALIMLPAYPIYKRIARKTKDKLTPEIISLSEEIINSQGDQN